MFSRMALWASNTALIALLVVAVGCGKQSKVWELNSKVEGVVKLDGAPVPNVFVQFVPEDPTEQGPISRGQTDEKGHFTLTTEDDRDGAVVGKHVIVVVNGRNDSGSRLGAVTVPPTYRTVKDRRLVLDVTPDKHSYDVDLKR